MTSPRTGATVTSKDEADLRRASFFVSCQGVSKRGSARRVISPEVNSEQVDELIGYYKTTHQKMVFI